MIGYALCIVASVVFAAPFFLHSTAPKPVPVETIDYYGELR